MTFAALRGRLTLVITSLGFGGAEMQLVRLATALRRRGWVVNVVSLLPPEAFVEDLEAQGVTVASLNMSRGIADPRSLWTLRRLLKQWRPDVVHSHMVHANLLTRLTRCTVAIPVLITTAHSMSEGARWRELAYRLTDPLCDLTTNVSEAAVARYLQIKAAPEGKIRFVPNGLDAQAFVHQPEARERLRQELELAAEFVWLAVGRFDEAKDYPTMLRAFSGTLERHPRARLVIAGDGALRAGVESLATELGLTTKVNFLGIRRDVAALMSAADAYVMSSAWEGLPMVLLEASAAGLPIVATDVGGNREVVVHETSGYLVPAHDATALSNAMCRLMALPHEERRHMGQMGYAKVVKLYDLERVVDRWEQIYTELAAKRRRPAVA